jgi:exodeoxyribonuclease VII small subunit
MEEKFSYSKALAELQDILSEIDGNDVEIDKLASKVKRAVTLIKLLREKLKKTEFEIKEIVKGFDSAAGEK